MYITKRLNRSGYDGDVVCISSVCNFMRLKPSKQSKVVNLLTVLCSAVLLGWDLVCSRSASSPRGEHDILRVTELKRIARAISVAILLLGGGFVPTLAREPLTDSSDSDGIIRRYLSATQGHDSLRGASMEVSIDASVPKLKENGKLRALRKISKLGQITYHILAFQGDSTVKNQVIARYLEAEQQGRGDQDIAITPQNYKFKFRGERSEESGRPVYVFQLSPLKKRVGLFKGELWLDTRTYLPLFEKGRLVKNPSVFFKQVDFERGFAIQNGLSVPTYISSTINTHLIGKVELKINFSNIEQDTAEVGEPKAAVVASSYAEWVR